MQQHIISSPDGSVTDTSCYDTSSEDGSPWFGMNASISSFARSLGQNIDDIAHSINRGARNIINELAELENEAMRDGSDSGSSAITRDMLGRSGEITILPLPWEICLQSTDVRVDMEISIVQTEDQPLKRSILDLSLNAAVFTQPFAESTKVTDSFRLDDARVMLIRRLLEIDENLGRVHAKVSGTCNLVIIHGAWLTIVCISILTTATSTSTSTSTVPIIRAE